MKIFKELPSTAGWPIYTRDLLHALAAHGDLAENFKQYLNFSYARLTPSGTAALYLILEALKTIRPGKKVVIPSYICPLVPLAVKRAGLAPVVCDIREDSFDFDLEELEEICSGGDILAVIPTHLAGLPIDFDAIKGITAKRDIILIEDCAQGLGARYKNKPVGTLGDVAFFSLARGKGLTIYEGGVVVTGDAKLAGLIEDRANEKVKFNLCEETLKILELLGYWMLYRRAGFWFIFGLPRAFWKSRGNELKAYSEEFSIDFPVQRVSRFRDSVGAFSFVHLEKMLAKQRAKADEYIGEFSGIAGIRVIKELPYARANYPYLAVIFDDHERRDKVLAALQKEGLGVSLIYLKAICDYPYLKGIVPQGVFPNARFMASRALSLSTSIFVRSRDISRIARIIRKN